MKKYLLFMLLALAVPVLTYAEDGWDDPDQTGVGAYFHTNIGNATAHFYVLSESPKTCKLWYNNGSGAAIENADGDLEIPSEAWGYTVVEIGNDAMYQVQGINKVTVPSTVTKLGAYSFAESSITELDLSATSVEAIPNYVSNYCPNLTKVLLPSTVKTIGMGAFRNNSVLPTVELPEGVTTIGNYAFYEMGNKLYINEDKDLLPLSMYIPSTVTSIGTEAFRFCLGHRDWDTGVITYGVITSAIREPFDAENIFGRSKTDYKYYGKLIVATDCKYKYEARTGWEFSVIEEVDGLPETDSSVSLNEILTNGTDGTDYQIRDELQVMDQYSVTITKTGLGGGTTITHYVLATNGTNNVMLQIPDAKYKDLDGVLSLAGKSVTGTLKNKDLNPYFVVTSQPTEGDGEDEYEIRTVNLSTYWNPKAYEPFTGKAFVNRDGTLYSSSAMEGNGIAVDYTYMPGFIAEKGATYNMKAFVTLKQAEVPEADFQNYITIYPYSMELSDEPRVEFSTPLATILSEGVNGQTYIVKEKLYVADKGVYATETVQFGFLRIKTYHTDVFATDGNDNWIKLAYLTNTYGSSNNATALLEVEGVLHDVETNPWLEVTVAPTTGDGEFAGVKTYDLSERFTAKPNEVFKTLGYVYDNNGVNSLAASVDNTTPTFDFGERYYALKDTAWVVYPNHTYDMLAVAQIAAPWSDELNANSDNYYTNMRVLPLRGITRVDAMITFDNVLSRNDEGSFGTINESTTASSKATTVDNFMNYITNGKEYIEDVTEMSGISKSIDGCLIAKSTSVWKMALAQPFNAKSVSVIARNWIREGNGRNTQFLDTTYLVVNGVTYPTTLTNEFAEYTFELNGEPLSELSLGTFTNNETYAANAWSGAYVKGINIAVYDPVITLTPEAGEYDEAVSVKVSVEDVPENYKVYYTLVPATDDTMLRAEAVETEYDDEQGIYVDKSATLTIAVRTAGGTTLKEVTANYVINDLSTGVKGINGGKAVKAVRYYNVAGVQGATPFQGVNIVVTEYQDGTTLTTKVVR